MIINIPKISNSDKAIADTFNKSLTSVETHLNSIAAKLNNITDTGMTVVMGVPAYTTVNVGDLVYMSEYGCVMPALASLEPYSTDTGKSIAALSSRVIGIVLHKDGDNVNILTGGAVTSEAVVQACIGDHPEVGTYYLSGSDAGKAVRYSADLPLQQPVFTYLGGNRISISALSQPQYNHFHAGIKLDPAKWVESTDGPEGYAYKYTDQGLYTQGYIIPNSSVFFINGVLSSGFVVYDGILWARDYSTINGTVEVFSAMPATEGSGYIRSVHSSNGTVKSNISYGIVDLGVVFNAEDGEATGKAVSSIEGTTVKTTPVVTKVSGVGLEVNTDGKGSVTVYAPGQSYDRLLATEYNLNGAMRVSDNLYTYIVIPGNSTGGFTITRDIFTNADLDVSVWVDAISGGEKALKIKMWFVPFPTADSDTVLPTEADGSDLDDLNIESIKNSPLKHYLTEKAVNINTSGILVATIMGDGSSDDTKILRAGFATKPATK